MRKILPVTMMLALFAAATAAAQGSFAKLRAHKQFVGAAKAKASADAATVTLKKTIAALYTAPEQGDANYYVVLAEKDDAIYNSATAAIEAKDCHVLSLDLYGPASASQELPAGTYKAKSASDASALTYDDEYSMDQYFGADGSVETENMVSGDVEVTKNNDGTYTIEATDESGQPYAYTGRVVFSNSAGSTFVYPQINADVNTTFTGGMAFYHGNLYESNTGNIYINLFDCDFDPTNGAMLGTGHDLAICAFNRLFPDPKKAAPVAGVYTVARNFHTNTYFPGMEVDYMGMTMQMGSYVKRRKSMAGGDNDYDYAYITGGTVTIENGDEPNTFNFIIDCTTADGHTVKGTAKNITIPVIDVSDDKPSAVVSNLDRDVTLNLGYIKTARAYNTGIQNNCNVFVVDIGSPSGKDGREGDLLRMEFLTSPEESDLVMGNYELMEHNHLYTNEYAPFKLVQGYFYNGGELTGTRYWHFKKGSYEVVDTFAAVISGQVGVEQLAGTDQYKFSIDLADGNGYTIKGQWTGPIERNYNPTAIAGAAADDRRVAITFADKDNLRIAGAASSDNVEVFAADGRKVFGARGAQQVNIGQLAPGMYIVKVGGKQTTKFVRK